MIKLRSSGKGLLASTLGLGAMRKRQQTRHHYEKQTGYDETSHRRHGVIPFSAA